METEKYEIPKPSLKVDRTNENEIVVPITIYPDLVKNEMDNKRTAQFQLA